MIKYKSPLPTFLWFVSYGNYLATQISFQKKLNFFGFQNIPVTSIFFLIYFFFLCISDPATLSIFATRPNPKKKRKSRTAFTNHQIFELEKRFLYQKYLSPADRDEIAAGLGLSNAQVSPKS